MCNTRLKITFYLFICRYYDKAYTFIKETRLSESNIVEVKLIAGFITYKLCYLMFKLNEPRDAIRNFKLHIEFYKDKKGSKELYFEHLNWLSKQYSAFGDIFNEAVKDVSCREINLYKI